MWSCKTGKYAGVGEATETEMITPTQIGSVVGTHQVGVGGRLALLTRETNRGKNDDVSTGDV